MLLQGSCLYPGKLRWEILPMQLLCGCLGAKPFFSYLNDKCFIHWTISSVTNILCFEKESLTEPGVHWLSSPRHPLTSALPWLGLQSWTTAPGFSCGCWDLTSDAHPCTASALLAEHLARLPVIFHCTHFSLPLLFSICLLLDSKLTTRVRRNRTLSFYALLKGGGKKGKKDVWLFAFSLHKNKWKTFCKCQMLYKREKYEGHWTHKQWY